VYKILTLHIFLTHYIKNGTIVPVQAMKAYSSSGTGPLFNLGSTGRSVVNFTHRPLYPRARTHWILGLAGPRTALDVWEKTEISCRNLNLSSSTS